MKTYRSRPLLQSNLDLDSEPDDQELASEPVGCALSHASTSVCSKTVAALNCVTSQRAHGSGKAAPVDVATLAEQWQRLAQDLAQVENWVAARTQEAGTEAGAGRSHMDRAYRRAPVRFVARLRVERRRHPIDVALVNAVAFRCVLVDSPPHSHWCSDHGVVQQSLGHASQLIATRCVQLEPALRIRESSSHQVGARCCPPLPGPARLAPTGRRTSQ